MDPAAPSAVELVAAIAAGDVLARRGRERPRWRGPTRCSRRSTASPRSGTTPSTRPNRRRPPSRAATSSGPLHGVPVAVKDTTPVAGRRTTLGSLRVRALGPRSRRLHRHRAATGRGDHRRADHLTRVRPHPADRQPAVGRHPQPARPSSARPAARRAAAGRRWHRDACRSPRARDMGGSVRIPAAWSGVVGLKPAFGRIPMDVLPGLFDSISHHGPLARCADDARLFLAATQGPDDADIVSIPGPLDLRPPAHRRRPRHAVRAVDRPRLLHGRPRDRRRRDRRGQRLAAAGAVVEVVPFEAGLAHEQAWMTLWSVFMAAYFGDCPRRDRRAHGSRCRRPDRPRPHRVGRRVQAGRAGAHRPVASSGRRARRPRRAAVPDDGRRRPGRRRRRPAASYRDAVAGDPDLAGDDDAVQPRAAVPGRLGADRHPRAGRRRGAADRPAGRSAGAGATTWCCEVARAVELNPA